MSRGDFIAGRFVAPEGGDVIRSRNPARDGEVVHETAWSVDRVGHACDAATAASVEWRRLTVDERFDHLERFRAALAERKDQLADALVAEVGKIRSEANGEAGALVSRFDLVRRLYRQDFGDGCLVADGRALRYAPLGVVGVIGPYNYPLHLCHGHVVPALLAGNAVVIKPSEVAPLCAERYAEAALAAELPPGVINIVHGRGASGDALARHASVAGICFTGSYAVGRKLSEVALDRPEMLLALEMGGKNTAVVLADADLRQAAHEAVVGAFLSSGQRCTATDRVLVQASIADVFTEAIAALSKHIRAGDPEDATSFAGPITTEAGRAKVEAAIDSARAAGAQTVLAGGRLDGGYYLSPSVHRLPAGVHHVAGYTDIEVFGPDMSIEVVADVDEAAAVVAASSYGLANSVFTASDDAFEHFFSRTRAGIVNRNRSTNQASPLLPFGGLGKSGNYRPAGSHAPRNVTVPVAVQSRGFGDLEPHPHLSAHLPAADLDALEGRFRAAEDKEAERTLLDEPRPMKLVLPPNGEFSRSKNILERLYAGGRVVREKKPVVFDHLRSYGPWFVSVDGASILDGMSQTATLCAGFAEDAVVQGYFEGAFANTLTRSHDPSVVASEVADAFAETLCGMVPGVPEVSFANSGAEANEKALALCRNSCSRPDSDRILAFEGSFHGRTLWSLSATYNPAKRTKFEIAGYEATFVPFPVWTTPGREEPQAPAGFFAAAAAGDTASLVERFGDREEHALVALEAESLHAVAEALATGRHFACLVEPMQSEGGDRYATARFFRALRLLTRHFDTDLVFDEVQTGFGLGGSFAWHSMFRLVDLRGQPDYPDAVTFAKRAQVGVCMSRHVNPEPTSSHPASLVRGRIHAEMMAMSFGAERVEELVRPRLSQVAQSFAAMVENPRAAGFAFAFDMPDAETRARYLAQRFWRGTIVYGAGSRTIRYRLSESYQRREVDILFASIRRSLAWLDAHPGGDVPVWDSSAIGPNDDRMDHDPAWSVRVLPGGAEATDLLPTILDIEYRVYEPVRRTPPQQFRPALEHPDSIVTVAETTGANRDIVGFSIGAPLEVVATMEEGPDRDPMLGADNTLYSLSVTVVPEYQGKGVGRALKEAQLRRAAALRNADGGMRYRHVTGRNRVGYTAPMRRLNRVFGAHIVNILTGQYADPEGQAVYYRIPLSPLAPADEPRTVADVICAADGLAAPLASCPELERAEDRGLLYGPAINKLTIMNFVTPAAARAIEWVSALTPVQSRLYLTSCRDELVDKTLRLFRCHRPEAQVAIGLDGGYVGHTSAAARSISDPTTHRQGRPVFAWPRVPHPGTGSLVETVKALDKAVAGAGGADAVLALFVEPTQERTGALIDDEMARQLESWCREVGVPLVAVETPGGCYRSGLGALASTALPWSPDAIIWWGGAQTGYLHVADRWRVDTPLTLVSTWDGDEISLVRENFQLRQARGMDLGPAIAATDAAAKALEGAGFVVAGRGLYRVIAGPKVAELRGQSDAQKLSLRELPGDRLAFVPPLDRALEAAERLARAAKKVAG